MYKKLLVLAALMSAVCFTAVAHEALNTQGSYYVAEGETEWLKWPEQRNKKASEKTGSFLRFCGFFSAFF